MSSTTLDCRGRACPQPVLDTKAALANAAGPFTVIVDNEGACTNVSRFAQGQGAHVSVERVGEDYHLCVAPAEDAVATGTREGATALVECPVASPLAGAGVVAYVASQEMGHGDDKLGAILMRAFLDTLGHFKDELSHVIFLNSGAKLAIDGSPVLDQVRHLEQMGVQVLVCGTCLSHFGIMDRLAVGQVSNMYAIIETLSKARSVIRP